MKISLLKIANIMQVMWHVHILSLQLAEKTRRGSWRHTQDVEGQHHRQTNVSCQGNQDGGEEDKDPAGPLRVEDVPGESYEGVPGVLV